MLETETNHAFLPVSTVQMYSYGEFHETFILKRDELKPGACINGPAVLIEKNTTIIIESGWEGKITEHNYLLLNRRISLLTHKIIGKDVDLVMLEIFNNRFMLVACAIFDRHGNLVANAPHIPVHLGSM